MQVIEFHHDGSGRLRFVMLLDTGQTWDRTVPPERIPSEIQTAITAFEQALIGAADRFLELAQERNQGFQAAISAAEAQIVTEKATIDASALAQAVKDQVKAAFDRVQADLDTAPA